MKKLSIVIMILLAVTLAACQAAPELLTKVPTKAQPALPTQAPIQAPTQDPTSPPTIAPTLTPTIKPTKAPTPTVAKIASRCVPASVQQIANIRDGIKSTAPSNDIEKLFYVKSNDFDSVYMVSGNITGAGINPGDAIGVWAISGTPDNPGLTLSVDGFAKSFSPWPDAS